MSRIFQARLPFFDLQLAQPRFIQIVMNFKPHKLTAAIFLAEALNQPFAMLVTSLHEIAADPDIERAVAPR